MPNQPSKFSISESDVLEVSGFKRVFSIGFEFEDSRVQNTEFHEPDSSLGHDLIYWDPSTLLDGYASTVNAGYTFLKSGSGRKFEKDRERRAAEFREHLKAGKPIVVAAPPPRSIIVSRVVQGETYDYEWSLIDPFSILPEDLHIEAARGKAFQPLDNHAFSKFWKWAEEISTYECYFVNPPGTPLLRISNTDKVVAMAVPVDSGVVLYLPRLDQDFAWEDEEAEASIESVPGENAAHKEFINFLWEVCQQFGKEGGGREVSLPKWTDDIAVPGEREAVESRSRAEGRLKAAQRAINKQEERIAELRERKILISGTGPSLERIVDEAFSALGFRVEPGLPGRTDRIIRRKRRAAVVEIKGKSKSASEKDAAQLEKWKSDYHATHGAIPKGILVVNAWKGKPLAERKELPAFPDQMLPYAVDQRQQCLLTGLQLLGLWLEVEAHPDRKDQLALSILKCEGIYPAYQDWREVLRLTGQESEAKISANEQG